MSGDRRVHDGVRVWHDEMQRWERTGRLDEGPCWCDDCVRAELPREMTDAERAHFALLRLWVHTVKVLRIRELARWMARRFGCPR